MKKMGFILAVIFWLAVTGLTMAAGKIMKSPEPEHLPPPPPTQNRAASNMPAPYPGPTGKLPPRPVPPPSIDDAKATTMYIAAVDAYLKAAQSYIDAATDDANKVLEERNSAVVSANEVANEYNTFFKLDDKESNNK